MTRTFLPRAYARTLAAGLAVAIAVGCGGGVAQAREEEPSTAAQTDQMLRPHFDFLEHRKRKAPGAPGGQYGPRPKLVPSVLVDCSRRESINDALYRVADNGVVNVRGVCHEPVYIDFPVKIVGENQSPFDGPAGSESTIDTPAGASCIMVARGVQATIEGMTILGDQSGRNSCVKLGEDANLTIRRSKLHYIGQKSAIEAGSGTLLVADSVINAMNYDPAIVTDGTRLSMYRTIIRASAVGLNVTPGVGGLVELNRVSIWSNTSTDDLTNEPEAGIIVRGAGSFFKGATAGTTGVEQRTFRLDNTDIFGFKVGVDIMRGVVGAAIRSTRIRHAVYGVISRADNLTITDSALMASKAGLTCEVACRLALDKSTGVLVGHGHAWIERNYIRFSGHPDTPFSYAGPVGTEDHPPAAEMVVRYNRVEPKDGCRAWPELHPWCGTLPDIIVAGDPTAGPVSPGWDGVPFTLPPQYREPLPAPAGKPPAHNGLNFFGITFGARAGGAIEPDVRH